MVNESLLSLDESNTDIKAFPDENNNQFNESLISNDESNGKFLLRQTGTLLETKIFYNALVRSLSRAQTIPGFDYL